MCSVVGSSNLLGPWGIRESTGRVERKVDALAKDFSAVNLDVAEMKTWMGWMKMGGPKFPTD